MATTETTPTTARGTLYPTRALVLATLLVNGCTAFAPPPNSIGPIYSESLEPRQVELQAQAGGGGIVTGLAPSDEWGAGIGTGRGGAAELGVGLPGDKELRTDLQGGLGWDDTRNTEYGPGDRTWLFSQRFGFRHFMESRPTAWGCGGGPAYLRTTVPNEYQESGDTGAPIGDPVVTREVDGSLVSMSLDCEISKGRITEKGFISGGLRTGAAFPLVNTVDTVPADGSILANGSLGLRLTSGHYLAASLDLASIVTTTEGLAGYFALSLGWLRRPPPRAK